MKRKVRSIYDAVIKTKIGEDQFTNFLIYLIQLYPTEILGEIFKKLDFKNYENECSVSCYVQYRLNSSIPDAVIKLDNKHHLVLETKIVHNTLYLNQIERHISGSYQEFGDGNFSVLILSPDKHLPIEIYQLSKKIKNIRIDFLSWKSLLAILGRVQHRMENKSDSRMLNEFIQFANNFKLIDQTAMEIKDLQNFNEYYSFIKLRETKATNLYNESIDEILDFIVSRSNKRYKKEDDDEITSLPLFYRAFRISRWFIKKYSAFVVIDIEVNKFYIVLTCYQNHSERKKFQENVFKSYEALLKNESQLELFTWSDNDTALYPLGRFEHLVYRSAKDGFEFNKEYLYIGYSFPLNDVISRLDGMKIELSEKINSLVDNLYVV